MCARARAPDANVAADEDVLTPAAISRGVSNWKDSKARRDSHARTATELYIGLLCLLFLMTIKISRESTDGR